MKTELRICPNCHTVKNMKSNMGICKRCNIALMKTVNIELTKGKIVLLGEKK